MPLVIALIRDASQGGPIGLLMCGAFIALTACCIACHLMNRRAINPRKGR